MAHWFWTCLLGSWLTYFLQTSQAVIPRDRPLTITQNGWCFDHQWSSDPDRLILYHCKGGSNQQFVWRPDETSNFSHLVSNLNDKCLGLDKVDLVQGTGRPKEEAPLSFLDCDGDNELIRWNYKYGTEQLTLAKFPDLCMDLSLSNHVFILYKCKEDMGHDEGRNQRAVFHDAEVSQIKPGMPVEIQHVTGQLSDWFGQCLDQSLEPATADELILFNCKRSNNQLFAWKSGSKLASHKDLLHLNRIVSSKDGRCIAAGRSRGASKPSPGVPLVLKDCEEDDKTILWRYAHGLQQLKLEKWPDLCMGLIDEKNGRMGILTCKQEKAWAAPAQHFRVLDLGMRPVPEHVPLTLEQNGWCVDQKFSADPDQLILYHCNYATNQRFVWRGSAVLGYHFLVSNLDDRCLGVDGKHTDSSGKPMLAAPISFKACNKDDDLIKWTYDYGPQQLRMKLWEDICMEFSEKLRVFTVAACRFEEYTKYGGPAYTQRMSFATTSTAEMLPIRLPVRINVGSGTLGRTCLDRPPKSDHLIKYVCKFKAKGYSINQEFIFRGNKTWHFSHIVSLVDNTCLGVGKAEVGALVTFRACHVKDHLIRWTYSHGKGFLKLAEYPSLCMDMSSDGKMIMAKCAFSNGPFELARSNQEFEVEDLHYYEIDEDKPIEVRQNGWCLDRPFGKDVLELYSCQGSNNQRFVWYNRMTWMYHWLISHTDNLCIGLHDTDVDAKLGPKSHAPITFKTCSAEDPTIRWVYTYGPEQLQLAEWPDRCMEFDDSKRIFLVSPCTVLNGAGGGLWPAYNQAIHFEGTQPTTTTTTEMSRRRRSDTFRKHYSVVEEEEPAPPSRPPAFLLAAAVAGTSAVALAAAAVRAGRGAAPAYLLVGPTGEAA